MSEETVSALVESGQASAGAPLGPALGPLGVNIGQVVSEINEKTAEFSGMTVPIEVRVDTETNDFEIEVGTPPASALIKNQAGIDKGSGEPNKEKVADISLKQAAKVAQMKENDLLSTDLAHSVKEILGTCLVMGVTVEGKDPRLVQQEIDQGDYDFDELLNEQQEG